VELIWGYLQWRSPGKRCRAPCPWLGGGPQKVAQGKGEADDPLAKRDIGKHLIRQQGDGLGHAVGATAGAEATLLTGKRDLSLEGAFVAVYPEKAVLEAAALQVGLELLVDMVRQGISLMGHLLDKGGIVRLDKLVEQCLVGRVALVGRIAGAVPGCQHGDTSDSGIGATSVVVTKAL